MRIATLLSARGHFAGRRPSREETRLGVGLLEASCNPETGRCVRYTVGTMPSVPRIKGVSLINHLEFVTRTFGPEGAESALARMPAGPREVVRKAIGFEWYPLETIAELDTAIVQAHYGGDASQAWRMGAYSFEKHVTTIYRVLMHTLQTGFVLSKAGALAARVVEHSTVAIRSTGPRQSEIRMGGYVSPSPVFCHLVRGCMMGVLFACGEKAGTVDHVRCEAVEPRGCFYLARW